MPVSSFRVHGVRYQTRDVNRAVAFYTQQLGFELKHQQGTAFANVSLGGVDVLLSGPGSSGARPLPDGQEQHPGGWNRLVLAVSDLPSIVARHEGSRRAISKRHRRGPWRQADPVARSGRKPGGTVRARFASVNKADEPRTVGGRLPDELRGRATTSCAAMSHSEALSRLTGGGTRSDMIRWVPGSAINKVGDWKLRAVTSLLAAAAMVGGFGLAAPAAAQVSAPAAAAVYAVTPKRAVASAAVVVGLIGAVIGGLALARSAASYRHRQRATRGHRGPGAGANRRRHRRAGRGHRRRWSRHRQRGGRGLSSPWSWG